MWDPMALAEVTALFEALESRWWIAGGYAIEAFVGRPLRAHDDVDVSFLRRDQLAIQRHLAAWDLHAADPPGTLRPWADGETLPLSVHDIWVRETADSAWRFQLMIDDAEGDSWIFRRDTSVRLPLNDVTWERNRVRYFQPELQLLFKAKGMRAKDLIDFEAALPLLADSQRSWLRRMIALYLPDHPWLVRLK